ncbi:MAG TPA: hypothetical protein VMD30_10940 [Tepidisphaeraceae bacterium]|nr:hypothetical protein [Tepidisphaeraceae bacterium]
MEEVLPPQTQEGAGFEPTTVRQFTVFLENRVGRLQSLVRALEEEERRIIALSVEELADTALVRLIYSHADSARQSLRAAGFAFGEMELLAVELPKRGRQSLVTLCSALLAAEINVHYLYPLLWPPSGSAVALSVDDTVLAAQLLLKKNFRLIGESDLRK